MRADLRTLNSLIKKLSYILTNKQKKGSILVFFSMLISSGLELIGVSIIYPLLDLMINREAADAKWYFRIIRELRPSADYSETLILLCLAIIIFYAVKNVVILACAYMQMSYSARFKRELSTLMLRSYLSRPYEFFINNNSAEILRGINGDATHTYQILSDAFDFLSALLTAVLIGGFLVITDWIVAIVALVLAGICFLIIVFGFKKKMKRAGIAFIDATTNQYKYSYQAINAIKEITVMDRRECFIQQYEDAARAYEKASVVNSFLSACPDRILEGICVGGFIGISCLRFALGGNIQNFIPAMGAFAMGAFKILPSISKMSNRINSIVYQQPSLYNCYENIKEARDIENNKYTAETENEYNIDNDSQNRSFIDAIEIKGVSWKYRNSDRNILKETELKIYKGEAIGIVGASGAGKSTLADLILGLYHPQKGTICVDGTDISKIPHLWARTIGYVPQTVYLSDDTVIANVAFGLPADQIDIERIWSALEQAQLADFVRSLPDGLYTIVGERGVKFSGGQRQRVAIARALYDNPEILILDEATSALDNETENAVMDAIDSLMGKKTLIIIAHRLSTISKCSRIFEIRDGKISECNKNEIIMGSNK